MAKQLVGIVSSAKGDKTIVVTVHTRKTHPLYKKQYTVTSKFMAHDEKNEAQPGDKVSIAETRPLSARKRHVLSEIIEKPVLREDTLALTKADDDAKHRDSKSKAGKDEEAEEAIETTEAAEANEEAAK